jgi:nitrite reductase/ring-hydroxylating ferredoxin subunit
MSLGKSYQWHKIADDPNALIFGANGLCEIEVAGKTVCLALHSGVLYGCAAKCPHAGGIMANGFVDPLGNIVCPLHRYRFSLRNGRNTSGEGYYLTHYPVDVRENGVFVGIEAKKSWF